MKTASHDEQVRDAELVVVKHVSWSRLQVTRTTSISATTMAQLGDDPMLEVDIATRICAAGNHKNVVQYHKILRSESGSFGIVMEYCNEGDLHKRLEDLPNHRMGEAEALIALREIANGLAFLHSVVGVAHRDISLENVLIRDGTFKIGDFGLSACVDVKKDGTDPSKRTVEGRVGKLGYMAPEVAAGIPYDPFIADMWSLGVSFFILLTGSPLIELASVDCAAFRAFCRLGLRRVLTDWKMIDDFREDTLDLVERMLQVDPHNRITLEEMQNHPAIDALAL